MTYAVKEMFYTLQGEGAQTGRPSVFLRFAGCNLWSGLERDREDAICQFCDTEFVGTDGVGGGKFSTAQDLAARVASMWPKEARGRPFVVCTGGEPLLQIDEALIEALHNCGFEIAVETNGTIRAPQGIDWLCVSPKAGSEFIQVSGNELKLVFEQEGMEPADFSKLAFDAFYLQPMDGPDCDRHKENAIKYCLSNPQWRLSQQTHKILGIS